MGEGSDWLSPTELAEILGLTRRTVFRMIEDGRLPEPKRWNARVVKWKKDDLADILANGPKPPGTFKPIPAEEPPAPKKTTRAKKSTRSKKEN